MLNNTPNLEYDKTWQLIKTELLRKLEDCTSGIFNPKNTYEQMLEYRARGNVLRELLNLPRDFRTFADTPTNKRK